MKSFFINNLLISSRAGPGSGGNYFTHFKNAHNSLNYHNNNIEQPSMISYNFAVCHWAMKADLFPISPNLMITDNSYNNLDKGHARAFESIYIVTVF